MIDTLRTFDAGNGKTGFYHSLPALEEKGLGKISSIAHQHPDCSRIRAAQLRREKSLRQGRLSQRRNSFFCSFGQLLS